MATTVTTKKSTNRKKVAAVRLTKKRKSADDSPITFPLTAVFTALCVIFLILAIVYV